MAANFPELGSERAAFKNSQNQEGGGMGQRSLILDSFLSFLSVFFLPSFLRRRDPTFGSPQVPSPGGQQSEAGAERAGGTEPHSRNQVALPAKPRAARRLSGLAAATEAASGALGAA